MTAPALQVFIAEATAKSRQQPDPADCVLALAPLMLDLIKQAGTFLEPQHYRSSTAGYTRNLIFDAKDASLSLYSIVWLPGQWTPVHDHGSWGVVGIVEGILEERSYVLLSPDRGADTEIDLARGGTILLPHGAVTSFVPPDQQDDSAARTSRNGHGTVFSFMVSGQVVRSTGENFSFGPALELTSLMAIDRQVLDHQADLASSAGWFLQRTPAGWFRVAEGDPEQDPTYDYYIDPEPFLLEAPFEVGEQRTFSGLRRGVWDVPGGGYEAWSGTWTHTYTHVGHAAVTTPLGSFDAASVLRVASVDTVDQRALFPDAFSRGSWTEYWWFVPGYGAVQVQGSGLYETDFDGNGVFDYWSQESQLMVAVPEPAAAGLMVAGLLALLARLRRG